VPSLSVIAAFAAASILLLVIPGPAVLYIVNRSVSDGRTVGLAAVAGVQLGTFVHAAGAALGLSAVLATSAVAFSAVKWLGAGYLIYVGIRTLATRAPVFDPDRPGMSVRRAFGQGFVVNLFNPKVALFFLSFLPQFIHPDAGRPVIQAMVLGLMFCCLGVVSDSTYSLLAARRSEGSGERAHGRRADVPHFVHGLNENLGCRSTQGPAAGSAPRRRR